ncbi:hypothetical protein MASR2M12_18180 [Bacteroidales bacterium]
MKSFLKISLSGILFTLILTACGGGGSEKKELVANIENGKAVYNKACVACHWKGVAGAAALDDKPRWEEMADKGKDVLLTHAIQGFTGKYGVMPEKGNCLDCSEQDLFDAISYMMNQAGVAFHK